MFESDTGPPLASFRSSSTRTPIYHLLATDIFVLSWAKLFMCSSFFFLKEWHNFKLHVKHVHREKK